MKYSMRDIDFGDAGTTEVTICGRAPEGTNTIHLRFKNDAEEIKEILEFKQSSDYEEQSFEIAKRTGTWNISFVFLPGSNFDFKSFRFSVCSGTV